ncbi:UNVERIFIED_CONTAM: hypothetical protein NCL1_15063 [Trichonephila clavipes]
MNSPNCRIWVTEERHAVHDKALHATKVTVWCGSTASFILTPYFFERVTLFFSRPPQGLTTCSVNGERHREINEAAYKKPYSASPHITSSVQQLLRQAFTDARVISRSFPKTSPPRSPNLTPCDFWLWSF